jgi:valyl-tRNA synthetase
MNQDQVKTALLSIEDAPLDFSVIFSGTKSKKVNGLYKPESREIVIHNRNFTDDNLLFYTALHEYAHHLHACSRGGNLSSRSHTSEFWSILHRLLEKAETSGVYKNVFTSSPELNELTDIIRRKYLEENGNLVKEFGMHLIQASELCMKIGGRFDDYIDRVLRIPKSSANMAIKIYQYDLDSSLGADNMRFLAGIRNEDERSEAQTSLLNGKSPDTVRIETKTLPQEPKIKLEKEKTRLEKTIASLSKRLDEVEKELELY